MKRHLITAVAVSAAVVFIGYHAAADTESAVLAHTYRGATGIRDLRVNGVSVPEATEELYAAMNAVAERRMDKVGLAALLRRLCGEGGAA